MTRNQIIAIGFCLVLLIGIYFFGKTTKPKDNTAIPPMAQGHALPQAEALNIEDYIADVNTKVTDEKTKGKLETLAKLKSYAALVGEYQKLDKPLAVAYYTVKQAEAENRAETWVKAGDYNAMLMQTAPDEKSKKFLSANAIECYKGAVELDSTKADYRIRLAGAHMEEGSQPMNGVLLLLDVVRKDSNNVDAQMMLGRFGLISGQIDKAIARFEKILYLQPQNSEALFMLAQAYDTKGDKTKALELLEKCRKTVTDPQAKKEIEETIENIKKSKN
jgi:tetratricopeptide (TPR) repeat protein